MKRRMRYARHVGGRHIYREGRTRYGTLFREGNGRKKHPDQEVVFLRAQSHHKSENYTQMSFEPTL